MQQTRRNVLRAVGIGGVSVLGGIGTAQQTNGGDTSRVRGIHAIPGGPNVDVYVDDDRVVENIGFEEVSQYYDFAAGRHTVQVVPTGQDRNAGGVEQQVTLEPNEEFTVAAAGTVQSPTGLVYTDDDTVPSGDQVRLRVIHLSPDAPSVDVAAGGKLLVADLSFGEASEYLTVPAGSYTLDVLPTGGSNPVGTFPVTLDGGTVVTAFAVGLVNAPDATQSFDLVTAVDAPR